MISIPTEKAELISRCLEDSPRRGVRKFAKELRVCWFVSTEPNGTIIKDRIHTGVSEHLLTHMAHDLQESLRYLDGKNREVVEGAARTFVFLHEEIFDAGGSSDTLHPHGAAN